MRFKSTYLALAMLAGFGLALGACSSSSDGDKTAKVCPEGQVGTYPDCSDPPDPAIAQRAAIKTAIDNAETAVAAVDNDSTDAEVSTAEAAVAAATGAIAAATAVPAEETAANTRTVTALSNQLTAAKTARQTAMDNAADAADKAMMATAMKLHTGIIARNTTEGAGERNAEYAGASDANIMVTIGSGEGNEATLKENKKATVAANHGWTGKAYADPDGGDNYVAHVYSNVGKSKEGRKFASTAEVTQTGKYEYQLNNTAVGDSVAANTELNINTDTTAVQERIASPSFSQSAGKKEFKLPENALRVRISGTYHGVSGSYYCQPASNETCSASVATKGFTLANGTWTFKASNNEAKVMSAPDTAYASYGWWLKKDADGKKYTASAFTDNKGDAPSALSMAALRGKATYMGGAAGKYALYSATGGTNDAGHFTARAMLEATFAEAHKVSGTIDNFVGADGMSRDWKVELMESGMSDTGMIQADDGQDVTTENPLEKTVWTIGGTKAAAAGQWMGNLQEAGDDGVPEVAKGTFYSKYSTGGVMVGAFGATKQ